MVVLAAEKSLAKRNKLTNVFAAVLYCCLCFSFRFICVSHAPQKKKREKQKFALNTIGCRKKSLGPKSHDACYFMYKREH